MDPAALSSPLTQVGGRFVVDGPLARGASGSVYAATDTLSGEAAALKRILDATPEQRLRARREAAALRALAIPGLARLLDSGEDDDGAWIAMSRVHGAPFPGPLPRSWAALRPAVEAMLVALAALHRAELVHRDLKPANVLVTAQGSPVIVDFGLTWSQGPQDGAGTPRFMAPEQAEGDEVDGRADLYALGRMILDAVEGADDLPDEVEALLVQMTAPDPEDRPASAGEVSRRLGAHRAVAARVGLRLGDEGPWSRAQLRALFTGHERVLHLPSDGAEALWRRTGGAREAVEEVLSAWVAEGLATMEGDGFSLPRASLMALDEAGWPSGEGTVEGLDPQDAAWLPWIRLLGPHATVARLRALWPEAPRDVGEATPALVARGAVLLDGETPRVLRWPPGFRARLLPIPRAQAHRRAAALLPRGARLPHLIAGGAAARLVVAEAERVARRLLREGRPTQVIAALELALSALRRATGSPGAPRLVSLWARAVLSLGTPRELDRALFEAERSGGDPALMALLHGARRAFGGDGAGALALLDPLAEFEDEELEIWRQATRMWAAWRVVPPCAVEVLAALVPWAEGRPAREAALAGWSGTQAYLEERYDEALARHVRSARGKTAASARRSSILNAASAALELGALRRVETLARRALLSAEAARHGAQTLEAERLIRAARTRAPGAETTETPDLELVEVAFSLGRPATGAQVAIGEAALAFRQGKDQLVEDLAREAAKGFARERLFPAALLAEALRLALRPDPAQTSRLLGEAGRCPVPGLGVQAAALVVWSLPEGPPRAEARDIVRARRADCHTPPSVRQEVLSLNEIDASLARGLQSAPS